MTLCRNVVRLLRMLRLERWQFVLGILILALCRVDCRAAAKPNIILITIDSARADRMGFLGAHSGLTPALDALARQGLVFAQAYAQSPSTVTSHATLLTGTYPQINRAGEFGAPLPVAVPYLPSSLRAAGYKTAAFVGSIQLDPHNGPFQRYDRGFDVYDSGFHSSRAGETRYQSAERHGEDVVARAMKWLSANKGPFFLWVNLHGPASSPNYDRAIAAADAVTGKLLASLRSQQLYENAVIAFAAPHGESLGAHGEDRHSIFLYDETTHVPLIVKVPKAQASRQVKNRARLVDLAPTLLEAVGVPVPSQMQGQSLLRIANSQRDQPVYARSDFPHQQFQWSALESWRAGKYLYIRAPKPELYDLSADPGATHNLAQTSKATLDTLASQLQAFDTRLGAEPGKSGDSALTSSEMQKLASLGYVGLQKSVAGVNAGAEGTDPKDAIAAANNTIAAAAEIEDGKAEKAVTALKQIEPPNYLSEFALATALQEQQKFSDAIPHLHKAIELEPDSPWAHYAMGLSLTKTGDFKTAVVHLQIAASRLPGFSSAQSALAEAQKLSGEPRKK